MKGIVMEDGGAATRCLKTNIIDKYVKTCMDKCFKWMN